jgi:hypothetical protein
MGRVVTTHIVVVIAVVVVVVVVVVGWWWWLVVHYLQFHISMHHGRGKFREQRHAVADGFH